MLPLQDRKSSGTYTRRQHNSEGAQSVTRTAPRAPAVPLRPSRVLEDEEQEGPRCRCQRQVGPFELDCQYRCNESDSKLVVKWFFNGETQPFYQWIAELEDPVVTDRYADVIDMDRSHAPGGAEACNMHTWHLRLVKPTIDMSGKYRCEVLTLANQDSAEASMMVFAPPSTFHFNYTKSSSERATLLCEVDGAFPMPHLKMYRLLPDSDDDKAELVNVQLTTERRDGLYRATMTSEVLDASLPQDEETVFLCSYTFKEIKYHRFQRLVYVPVTVSSAERTMVLREAAAQPDPLSYLPPTPAFSSNPATIICRTAAADEAIHERISYSGTDSFGGHRVLRGGS
ncbi:hypothetical protein HPB49_009030 [Dermacentor silvarum]|uniref:Uncharacterized protein n=1 Tax=Dermacentor silvarum TaxID=543639 RepID=A0ACB8CJY8_DERSI|nr:hypothetical protein HPB49_009030 [Dermacentor silvarum]